MVDGSKGSQGSSPSGSDREAEPPPDRCGYEWPADCERITDEPDSAVGQFSCVRPPLSDADRCVWHADPAASDAKTAEALRNARISDVFQGLTTPSVNVFDGADLSGMDLEGIQFAEARLPGADLSGADLSGAVLRRAALSEAVLRRAALSEADLGYANLSRATLRGAALSEANLRKTDLSRATLRSAVLSRANLRKANLSGADFGYANLSEADLWDAKLLEANLRKTDLSGAVLRGAALSGAFLGEAALSGADLGEADLSGADLGEADLSEADLGEADLSEADLGEADLSGANLREADLSGVDLGDTDLSGATLRGAALSGANLQKADLSGAVLGNADLSGAVLGGVTFVDADLSGASLDEVWIADASLRNAEVNTDTSFGVPSVAEQRADETAEAVFDWWGVCWLRGLTRVGLGRFDPDQVEQLEEAAQGYRLLEQLRRETALPPASALPVQEKHAERKLAAARGGRALVSWARLALARWITLYGESPYRIVATSLVTILAFGLGYHVIGGIDASRPATPEDPLGSMLTGLPGGLSAPALSFVSDLYFSTITFTTISYAAKPVTVTTQAMAALESGLGAVLLALLVAVTARRLTR